MIDPGTIFAGDYRVVRPLNQGGMGAVFVVQQLSTGKLRALKLMHRALVSDPQSRQRFEQEARIGARIASEHVVEVVAAGVDAASQLPYLVMELLEGEDMSSRLRRGPFDPREASLVLEQIAHALGAAHDAGVVHRDLKPENVFLGVSKRSTGSLVVKLLDFGIAKVTEQHLSNTTGAYGTPMWLAPEQTRRGEITPAADVWAFGLLTFTMLTGHPFWRSAEGPGASLPGLLQDILNAPIPPASSRAAEYAMRMPVGFDAWLARALERDPRGRFSNVRVAWQALAPLLASSVPEAAPPAQRRSNAGVVVLASLSVVALGVLAVVALMILHRADPVVASSAPPVTAPSVSPSSSPDLALVASIFSTALAVAPPAKSASSLRIGGSVHSQNQRLEDDAIRQFNGELSRQFDVCIASIPSGPNTQSVLFEVRVASDGSVTTVRQMGTTLAGPAVQCLLDTLSRAKFVSTVRGAGILFNLMWKST